MQARHLFLLWSFYFIFKNGSSAISVRKSTIRYTMLSEEKCCIMMPRGKYPQSSVFIVSFLGKKKSWSQMSLPDVLQRTFISRKFYLQYYPRNFFPKTFLGTRKVLHDFQKVVFQTIFLKK